MRACLGLIRASMRVDAVTLTLQTWRERLENVVWRGKVAKAVGFISARQR